MPRPLASLLVILVAAATARAADVQVLVVGDSKPYRTAARAAASALGGGAEAASVPIDAPLPARWQGEAPRVVIAVGARAVRLALTLPDTLVVAAMVLQESPELQNPRVHSVPLAVAVDDQLQLLTRLAPGARRIGLVADPRHTSSVVTEARAALDKRKQELVLREVQDEGQVAATFDELLPKVDAVLLVADTTIVKREVLERLVQRSLELRVPTIGYSAAVVQAGLVAGIGVEPEENGVAAAMIARALAAGREPAAAELHGHLYLNLKSARVVGVTVPADLLAPPTTVFDPR